MSHLSGTFSNAFAGRLVVTLSATFWQSTTGRDAGFPPGVSNYLLRGVVNGNYTEPLDRFAPVSTMELDYPGGGASWAVSTEEVSHASSGTQSYGFTNLKMHLKLYKK